MELTDSISTEEIKSRLQNLKEHMPTEAEFTYDFAQFFAGKLNPQLNPMGFYITFDLALSDANRGVDSQTKKPVPLSISGMPPVLYAATKMALPEIARSVCPSEFADKVIEMYNELNKK